MKKTAIGLSLLVAAVSSSSAFGATTLFSENFDTDPSANWTVNDGPTDFTVDWQFDYSTIGIPEAPNSTGTTPTTGLKMTANEFFATFGGFSVSPTGLDLSGQSDYVLKYDFWHNFHGPAPGGGSGTTQISYAGILTSGTSANYPGTVDGVFFAETLDGGSSADWRAYSSAKSVSYQATETTSGVPVYEASAGGTDSTARNASNPYYYDRTNLVGPFPGQPIPAAQTAIVQGLDPNVDHTGTAQDGITAFSWAEGEIAKVGNVVTWKVNGVLIATVNLDDVGTGPGDGVGFDDLPTGGHNILLGHSDTNSSSSTDALFNTLTFSLYDNIRVETIDTAIPGDLDGDGFVGISDLNIVLGNWNQNVTAGDPLQGDPSGDGFVGIDDLNAVLGNWNAGTPPAGAAVPEPATLALLGLGGLAALRRR